MPSPHEINVTFKRVAAWFCLLAGGVLNIELLLTRGTVDFVWLLLIAFALLYFQKHGFLKSKQDTVDTHESTDL